MIERRYNLVTFLPDDVDAAWPGRVRLKLEGDFVLGVGIAPSGPNRAVVPYTEYAKLLDKDGKFRTWGRIEFWSELDEGGELPERPSHSIEQVRIVDVEPLQVAIPLGDEEPRVVEYRLFLTDRRCDFSLPRGGFLTIGRVNDSNAASPLPNSSLIQLCLNAMGLHLAKPIPVEVDEFAPLKDLEWNGAHAAGELAKVLEHVFAVLCLRSDGNATIEVKGIGDVPKRADYAKSLYEIPLPPLRTGRGSVVVTSMPTAIVDTLTESTLGSDEWEFVLPDASVEPGKITWVAIDQVPEIAGDVVSRMQAGLAGIPVDRQRFIWDHAWRYIRLSKRFRDPKLSPVLDRMIDREGLPQPIRLRARVALQQADGTWVRGTGLIDVPIQWKTVDLNTGECILCAGYWLANVDVPTADRWAKVVRLRAEDLRVSFSFEASSGGNKEYFVDGYTLDAGEVKRLTDAQREAAIARGGKDVLILRRPSMGVWRVDGDDINREDAEKWAEHLARLYLRAMAEDCRTMSWTGFCPVELSGQVAEIRWSQDNLTTTIKINTWAQANYLAQEREIVRSATRENFAGEIGTFQRRLELGASGARQQSLMMGPAFGVGSGSGLSVSWGVVKEPWVSGQNTVKLLPCRGKTDGTLIEGAAEITAFIYSPRGVQPVGVRINQGEILPYLAIGDNEGLLMPVSLALEQVSPVTGVSIVGNDWVFQVRKTFVVAGEVSEFTILGDDCPEDG